MQLGMVLPGDTGPSAVLHVNESVQVHAEGEVRALFIGGVPMYRYVATDRAGVSYARVLLLTSGLATVTELASAFDCARLSIYRERERFEAEGIEGLVQKKRGPKGPSKLRGASQRRVVALRREGVPKLQIAQKLGVSEGTIRNVCKRLGLDEDKPSVASLQLPLSAPEVAEGDAQRAPANSKSVDVPGKAAPADEAVASQESSATPEAFEGAEAVSPEASSSSSPAEAEVSVSPGDSQPDTSDVPPLMGIHGRPESWNRDGDRALAALGLLVEAPPQFGPARQVRGAGALLAIPLLLSSGMLDAAREVYRSFGRAFYGVPTLFLAMALMALLRVRRPEWLRHRSPLDLGRLLGLDRAPEVKTLRRRIGVLAERGKSEEFLDKLARRRAESVGEALGFGTCQRL